MFERFLFENFVPNTELVSFANLTLFKLMDEAPGDAVATAVIERLGADYSCRIEINSINGIFAAAVSAGAPESAIHKAAGRIREKLAQWRKERRPALKPPQQFSNNHQQY